MENFADAVNEITFLCVTIVPWGCPIIKKGGTRRDNDSIH